MESSSTTRRFVWLLAAACAAFGVVDYFATMVGAIAPVRVYLLAAAVFGALTFVLARRRAPRRAMALTLAAAAFVSMLAWWPWHVRKSFFRDVDALELGAARADVRERMADWPQGHPYGEAVDPILYVPDPRKDLWHHNGATRIDNIDHVVVHYDEHDRVSGIERIVD